MKKYIIDKDKLGLLYFVIILVLLISVLGFFELHISNIFLESTTKSLLEKCEFNANSIGSRVKSEVKDLEKFNSPSFIYTYGERRLYFNETAYLSDKDLKNAFAKGFFDSSEYIFVVDHFGNIFFSSDSEYKLCYFENLYNFFNRINFNGSYSLDELQQKIIDKESGSFIYTISGQERISCFAPVPNIDWYVFSIIPMSYVSSQEKSISAIFFLIIIITIFAFIVTYIILKHNMQSQDYLNLSEKNAVSVYNQNQYLLMEFDFGKNIINLTGDSEFILGQKMYKISITEFVPYLENIHPDDGALTEQIKDFIKNQGFNYSSEFRFKCSDSNYYWFHLNSSNIFDKDGHNVKYIVNLVNVNARTTIYKDKEYNLHFDELTGVLKNEIFQTRIHTFLQKTKNKSTSALFIIDLDDLKRVNIMLGHSYGDIAIQNAAKHISLVFSQKDIIGRISANKFGVLLCLNKNLSEDKSYNIINEKAQMLCNVLSLNYSDKKRATKSTASIGISIYPFHGQNFSELLQSAESALYSVKQNGKNGYKIYNQSERITDSV